VPSPAELNLTPVHFVKLELTDAAGNVVSDNFYWLAGNDTTDLARLGQLPRVRLEASLAVRSAGSERIAEVQVRNPTDQVAMFIHLAVTKGPGGEEVLPVLWDDNYFSLAPGESRRVCARFAAADLGSAAPALAVGGWNLDRPAATCERLRDTK
jgi:hypothetical protein